MCAYSTDVHTLSCGCALSHGSQLLPPSHLLRCTYYRYIKTSIYTFDDILFTDPPSHGTICAGCIAICKLVARDVNFCQVSSRFSQSGVPSTTSLTRFLFLNHVRHAPLKFLKCRALTDQRGRTLRQRYVEKESVISDREHSALVASPNYT